MSHLDENTREKTEDSIPTDQAGHWQPAFRPDSVDDYGQDTASGSQPTPAVGQSTVEERVSEERQEEPIDPQSESNTLLEPDLHPSSVTSLSREHPDGTQSVYQHSVDHPDYHSAFEPSIGDPGLGARITQEDEIEDDRDEERLDPAWGIQRANTSQILGRGQRTASFPAFDEPESLVQDTIRADSVYAPAEPLRADSLMPHVAQPDLDDPDREVEDFAAVLRQGAEQTAETTDTDERYEEGVPLINHDAPATTGKPEAVPQSDAAWDTSNVEEASFFSDRKPQPIEPPSLDRKATADVLETLHLRKPLNHNYRTTDQEQSLEELPEELPEETIDALLQQPAGADTQLPEIETQLPEIDADAMWKAALDGDEDEFLVEDADDLLPDSEPGSPSFNELLKQPAEAMSVESSSRAVQEPRPASNRQTSFNPYAPHQPSTTDMNQFTAAPVQLPRPRLAPYNSATHQEQRPAAPTHQESYVDQAKGGYKSPYDLPLELSKPARRRPQAAAPAQSIKTLPPPPRSSSMTDKQLQPPFSPIEASLPPPSRSISVQSPPPVNTSPSRIAQPPKSSTSSFFEELPTSSRARPTSGRYTPQQVGILPPKPLLPQSPPKGPSLPSPPQSADPYAQFQLRPPEPLDPFVGTQMQVSAAPPSTTAARYSPAPSAAASLQNGPRPTPSPRYSPVPPQTTNAASARYASQPSTTAPPPLNRYASQTSQPSMSNPVLPFQPRTSSPLAVHRTAPPVPAQMAGQPQTPQVVASLSANQAPPRNFGPSEPPVPPQRPSTQSPGKQVPLRSFPSVGDMVLNRPASVQAQTSPTRSVSSMLPPPRPSVQQRSFVEEPEFVRPNDETQHDPLQRWKGAPIFRFGFSGLVAVSVPKHLPRFSAGSVKPVMRSTSGEVSIRHVKDLAPLREYVTSFPGPLRTKSKKKDVLAWMNTRVAALEVEIPGPSTGSLPDPRKRLSEKILLWKVVRVMVECDGILDGHADALKSINAILLPEVHAVDEATATRYRSNSGMTGIYSPAGSNVRPEPVDSMSVEQLRKLLLKGNRQDAVWLAADNRLWTHALLIASTLNRDLWKQVVHEFIRKEVKTVGTNAESLSALYEIFGGNLEESIDQLVPPSARAGLQMVSRVDNSGPTSDALAGLDRWRETLGLVLNNRSPDDVRAIATLSHLLSDYGRVEAAHICSLFARSPTTPNILGGADDPHTNLVLLGSDKRAPFDLVRDEDAILLTEVSEFATTVLAGSSVNSALPHLAPYKFQRAISLAEQGHKEQAQAYIDILASYSKSGTKLSPYYNPSFLADLEEFSNRLKQIPVHSSSWMAKPSIEKVSNSIFNKISSFVTGEDSDAESKGSGKDAGEIGPFAHVSGSTPSLSRAVSQNDLSGLYPASAPMSISSTIAGSRYAPNGVSSARSSSELTRARPSLDSQRSPPSSSYGQRQNSYEPVNLLSPSNHTQAVNPYAAPAQAQELPQVTPPSTSYMPNGIIQDSPKAPIMHQQESYIPTPPPETQFQNSYTPYEQPAPELDALSHNASVNNSYSPYPQENDHAPSDNAYGDYAPSSQSYGYEPPEDTGYVPYIPEPDSPEQSAPKPKKKSFMNNDDDDFPRVSNSTSTTRPPTSSTTTKSQKSTNDATADAAFQAAAEADAQRDKDKAAGSKGWGIPTLGIGGWFSRNKGSQDLDASSKSSGSEPKVYKAKLGEDKMSLYYDKELKKWVNPNDPDSGKAKAATPPPPPRAMGASPAPPRAGPLPPSREATPALNGPVPSQVAALAGAGPPSGPGTPAPPTSAGIMGPPPSRPATGLSNSSSIDDLIGPATGRKAGAKGKAGGKKGRYVDVMEMAK